MPLAAHALLTREIDPHYAGLFATRSVLDALGGEPPVAVLVYAAVLHRGEAVLAGVAEALGGRAIPVVGCSTQGVVGRAVFHDQGRFAGVMAIGGEGVRASSARVDAIAEGAEAKGEELAVRVLEGLAGATPKVVILHVDGLCGADIDALLRGASRHLACPIIGGAASHAWGPVVRTFQFHGLEVTSGSAVALALAGPIAIDTVVSTGTSPTGVVMAVTRAEANRVLELDGRRAIDVWREMTGSTSLDKDQTAAWAIGLQADGEDEGISFVRAGFRVDEATGAVILQAPIPAGARVMFHHRSVPDLLDGTRRMADELRAKLATRTPRAVLGFECGARTTPFLGSEETLEENVALQASVPELDRAAWLGMLAWGEIAPYRGGPALFNYGYPLLVVSDEEPAEGA